MKKPTVEQRRAEILEVTCEVVIERGFAGTRISDVAKRLDVSTSLIHYHFDSKEQLLAEAFSHYARKDLAAMEAQIEAAPSALEQLDRVIHDYVPEGSGDMEWMLWIDAWGEALRNPMMRTISQELDEHSTQLVVRVLEHGVATEEFDCPDPAGTALRLTALIDGLAVQFAAHDRVLDRDDLIDSVRRLAAAEVGIGVDAFDGVVRQAPAGLRPPSPSTEAALRRLVATANDAVLRRDAQAFGASFTEDGQWDNGRTTASGRAAIAAALTKALKDHSWISPSAPQYVFEVDESDGTGAGRGMVTERAKRLSGKVTETLAVAHDRYRRVGGTWQISARRLEILDRD
ncbi:MAG: TetR family transcriptional regulator C-terminal domain-containing protein [Ilumatobacteraceae bacterium]